MAHSNVALFRLSLIGPLVSRVQLNHGERKALMAELAANLHKIPNSNREKISPRTLERWYAAWLKNGIEGLEPKIRKDSGSTQLTGKAIERLLELKQANMSRSINTLLTLMFDEGYGRLSRSSVHRLLKHNALSHRVVSDAPSIERRQFEAIHANDIWYGDVMHGPHVQLEGKLSKVYLVSFMDDASRLLTHSAFCLDEQAVSVERVFKEAILRRGLPKRLIVDNGSAYRSGSLQDICASLGVHLIFCRPYEPESKGKLERWHRTVREQFINELDIKQLLTLSDLNERFEAWLQQVYHSRAHSGLKDNQSPVERYRQDFAHARRLGDLACRLDVIFYHRCKRKVSKTATIQFNGQGYEVAYPYASKTVLLVFDPHTNVPQFIEDSEGRFLCEVSKLDPQSNLDRKRQRPTLLKAKHSKKTQKKDKPASVVENALAKHNKRYQSS